MRTRYKKIECSWSSSDFFLTVHVQGLSALHLAASKGHSSAACALVDLGGNVNSVTADLTTPLHLAVAGGHTGDSSVLHEQP